MAAELPVRITADLSSFERDVKRAGDAAQQAASGGATALSKQFGQAKEQVALVGAAAARINPELGKVVNTASAAVGVLKSMVSPVGAFTAAVTVGLAAFVKLSGDIDKAEEKANTAAKNAIKAQLGIIDSGYYVNQALEAQDKVSLEARKGTWVAFARTYAEIFSLGGLNPIANAVLAKLDEYEASIAENVKGLEAMRDRNIELAQAELDTVAATKAHKDAVEDLTAAMQKEVQDTFDAKDEARKKDAKAMKAANAAEIEAAMEVYEINKALGEKQAAADKKQHEDKLDYQMDAIDAAANLGSSIVAVGKAMFGDSKEIAYAGAIIDTAAGIAKALGSAPPPLNFVNAVAVGIAGAAQIATIASTNIAHSGLAHNPAQSMAPDETSWKLRRNEGVLTERGVRGVGGYDQIRKLNAGQAPSMGGRFVGITKWQHKAMDTAIGANVSRPAAVRTEMKAIASTGGRVGHRLRSST